jgi:hyperosmotically inducible protein
MFQKFAVLVSAAAMAASVACAQSDAGITTAVKSKLAADDTVKAYQIDVDTADGVVTLTGAVDSAPAREQAVALARETDGVRDVMDRITIDARPTATTGDVRDEARDAGDRAGAAADRTGNAMGDAAITGAVKSKFLGDTAISGLKIDVDTKNGVVTLTGNVKTKAEADRAVSAARETEGVTRVVNNLKVAS